MARKDGPIEIPIAIDTGGVEKSIQNGLIDPIEDAEKALEALAKVDAGKDIDRDLKRAQDATEDLYDELDSTRKSLDKLGFAAKDAGDDAKRGMDRAGDGVKDFKGEADQAARETAASFDGSAESIGEMFQEVAANAFGGFGPAGAAAGLAAAVGIGLVTAEIDAQKQKADELRERLSGAYQEAAESGRDYLDVSQIIGEANDLMFNADRAEEYKRIRDEAKYLALDESTLIAANSGDLDAQTEVLGRIGALKEQNNRLTEEGGTATLGDYNILKDLESGWKGINTATKDLGETARNAQDVTSRFLKGAISDAASATEEVDALGNKLLTLDDGTKVVIDMETGKAHQDFDRFKGDVDGYTPTVKTVDVKYKRDTSEIDSYRPQPIKIPATFETRGREWQ